MTQSLLEELNTITATILHCSIEVHKELGPGLLESVYEICLAKELSSKGLKVQTQVALPVRYKNEILDLNFRIDMLVGDEIIVEMKTVECLLPVHQAQLLTYLSCQTKDWACLLTLTKHY